LNLATLIDDNIGSGAKQVALDQGSLGVQLVPPLLILCWSSCTARGIERSKTVVIWQDHH
jgi:hypothetical protein